MNQEFSKLLHDKQLEHDHFQKDTNQTCVQQIPKTSTRFHQQQESKHNLQPSSPWTLFSVSMFGFVDSKLKTIFLQPKETYELPQQWFITRFLTVLWAYVVCHRCWFCCLRVSKANLFWLLESTIIAYICTPVSSCWLNTKRNQKFVKAVPPSTWCVRKSINGTSAQTNQVRRQTNVSRQLNMDNAAV